MPSSAARRRSGPRPRAAPSRTTARATASRRATRRRSASRRCRAGSRRACPAAGSSAARSSCNASPKAMSTLRRPPSSSRSRGSSDRSTSTAWTCATRSARKRVRTPRPGPTSRTTSSACERREPFDHAEDVLVGEEVLAVGLLRDDVHGSPKTVAALASICAASCVRLLAPGLGEGRDRVRDVGRLVRTPSARHRREVRAVRLGEDPVGRHLGRRDAQLRRVPVRHVPREGDVVAALERRLEQARRREAVEDDVAVEAREHGERLRVGGPRVDHGRLAELGRERQLPLEQRRAAGRAARSRGRSRARSRRPRPRAGARGARGARRGATGSSPPAACGWTPRIAQTPRARSASSSAVVAASTVVATVRIRSTPASRARETRTSGGSSHASRCACVSITPRSRPAASARAPPPRRSRRACGRAASARGAPAPAPACSASRRRPRMP